MRHGNREVPQCRAGTAGGRSDCLTGDDIDTDQAERRSASRKLKG